MTNPDDNQPQIIHAADLREFPINERAFILENWNPQPGQQMSIARARVEPGVTTKWHKLTGTQEIYLIVAGSGRMEVGDRPPETVGPGDLVVIPPDTRQRITNICAVELVFYCICTPGFTDSCYTDLEDGAPLR